MSCENIDITPNLAMKMAQVMLPDMFDDSWSGEAVLLLDAMEKEVSQVSRDSKISLSKMLADKTEYYLSHGGFNAKFAFLCEGLSCIYDYKIGGLTYLGLDTLIEAWFSGGNEQLQYDALITLIDSMAMGANGDQ